MDLRGYLRELEREGELRGIEREIHWNIEAAAISTMVNRVGGPAVHFKRIKGYPEGYTLLGSLYTGPGTLFPGRKRNFYTRIAIGLELDKDIGYEDLMETLIDRKLHPVYPTLVSTGPCKEEIHLGDEVDLFEFPFPYLHLGDGGRYGTCGTIIAKDPDSDWQNWGAYRFMIVEKDKLLLNLRPSKYPYRQQLADIYEKYQRRGEAMPCCIAIGGEPAVFIASAMTVTPNISEAEIAGGLLQNPVEIVKAETKNLMVPANSEIVIEGEVLPGLRMMEGPCAEMVRFAEAKPQPVFQVKAITHRKSPILPFVVPGAKVDDTMALRSVVASMELLAICRLNYHHPVRWINLPVETRLGLCVVSTLVPYRGYVGGHLVKLLSRLKMLGWYDKIMVVQADVPPLDYYSVYNDLCQRSDPIKDWIITDEVVPLGPVELYSTPEDRERGLTNMLAIDTTWPAEWPEEEVPVKLSFETCFPKEIQDKVVKKWKSYGFTTEPKLIERPEKWRRTAAPQYE